MLDFRFLGSRFGRGAKLMLGVDEVEQFGRETEDLSVCDSDAGLLAEGPIDDVGEEDEDDSSVGTALKEIERCIIGFGVITDVREAMGSKFEELTSQIKTRV